MYTVKPSLIWINLGERSSRLTEEMLAVKDKKKKVLVMKIVCLISEREWDAGVPDRHGQNTEPVMCLPQLAFPEEGPATGREFSSALSARW